MSGTVEPSKRAEASARARATTRLPCSGRDNPATEPTRRPNMAKIEATAGRKGRRA
jgi:hypothetical protein